MGWTSTADALDQVARSALQFGTKEDAIAFCKKHGWEYAVREPQMRRTSRSRRYAGYGDNFRCACVDMHPSWYFVQYGASLCCHVQCEA